MEEAKPSLLSFSLGDITLESKICPRCNGTGSDWPGMICGTCHGKKTVDFEVCSHCKHAMSSHSKLEHLKRFDCESESGSGSFMCGCQGDGRIVKPVCNVCGKDFGNSYCLNAHLGNTPSCKQVFEVQFY